MGKVNPHSQNLKFESRLKRIFSVSTVLYVFLSFSRFYFESGYLTQLLTLIFIILGFFLFFFVLLRYYVNTLYSVASLALIFNVAWVALVGQNETSKALLLFFANLGFCSAFVKYPLSPKVSRFIFFVFSFLFIGLLVSGTNAEDIFRVSRNYISIFFLLLLSVHYIACWNYNLKPGFIYSIAGLVFALIGIGRAGIAVFFVIVFLTFLFVKHGREKKYLAIIVAFLVFALFLFNSDVYFFNDFELIYAGFERFERLGVESARHGINASYFNSLFEGFKSLLFGVPLSSLDSVQAVGGNPHNSYINLHVNFGLFGSLILMASIFIAACKLFLMKSWALLIVFSACLARSFFDIAAFYGPLDLIILFPVVKLLSSVSISIVSKNSSMDKLS